MSRLPRGWVEATLEECCQIIQGQSPPGDTYNELREGLPFFQGKTEFGDLYPTPRKWCSAPTKIALAQDVLISVRAPVGPTNLCRAESCIGRGLAAVRALAGSSPRYILYALRESAENLRQIATGSTFEAISGDDLRKHSIRVAPVAEQRRIVDQIEALFTDLDAAMAALKRVQANLKRYRASVLKAACEGRLVPTEAELARKQGRPYETGEQLLKRILRERRARWEADQLAKMLASGKPPTNDDWKKKYKVPEPPDTSNLPGLPEGWTWANIDIIAETVGGITKGQKRRLTDILRTVPYLRVANVQRGYLDLSEMKDIQATEEEINDLRLQPNDILFNEGGDRDKLGRGWIWEGQIAECIHQNHVYRARLITSDVEPRFVSYFANSAGRRYFMDEGKQTTNLASINLTKLRAFPVPTPPSTEQRRIVAELQRQLEYCDFVVQSCELGVKRASRLRQAILKRAFEGKLVPQDPNDEPASVLLERIRAEREPDGPMNRKRKGKTKKA